jgi:hypothetical protein
MCTVRIVLVLLNELDTYGLELGKRGCAPGGEYELEAAPIARRR